jgi:cytochrome P450
MSEFSSAGDPFDRQVDDFLTRFIFDLYAQAHRPKTSRNPTDSVVSDAGQIDAILRAPDRFQKNYSLITALGHSRFSTNGSEWKWRRDLTQTAYTRAGTADNRDVVAAAYAEALAACDGGPSQAIPRALLAASTKIFFLAFGRTVLTESLLTFFDRARRVIKRLQYHSWLASRAEELAELRDEVHSLLEDFGREIAHCPQLKELMEGLQRRGEGIENFAALNELLMNFFAGIETTAATLSFAIDRLGIDKRVEQRLLTEVNSEECPYLECFLNETMRYFPAIPFVVRQVASDTTIDGCSFRMGQLLVLSIVGVHHDRRYWKKPEIFDCSRVEFLGNTYDRRAFIPFLTGPRTCGGARLARMELTEGLKAFIRRFKVERKGDEIKFDYGLALRPNSWDLIEISKRILN